MKKAKYIFSITTLALILSCTNSKPKWSFEEKIELRNTTPIGLAVVNNHIWVADGDNNQLVHLDETGKILFTEGNFERPMHIGTDGESIFIPEYGRDQIVIFKGKNKEILHLTDSLDAPAGVFYKDDHFAIADFYNHRILYGNKDNWISIGKEGKEDGEFYYPTDVHIAHDKIFVADAYNNRVQVFTLKGDFIMSIGKNDRMNASTGIYVENEIFVTDFENDRVLVYSLEGNLIQTISEGLDKPTDVLVHEDVLYITNYNGKNLIKFKRQ